MVVVSLRPTVRFMERSGIATSTRAVANRLWPEGLPDRPRDDLVRELYYEENRDRDEPSGSQDMIGIVQPGISRLDYDFTHEGGIFPAHIESGNDAEVARWLEQVVHILPVAPRPPGYETLGEQHLDPEWIRRLGRSGYACFEAVLARDTEALGASVNESMTCLETIFPATLRHPALTVDWPTIVGEAQERYAGATMSASGGGYLFVISDGPVPGSFRPSIRLASEGASG